MASLSNSAAVNFGTLTAGANVVVSHYVLRFGTHVAVSKTLQTQRTFVAGDAMVIAPGDLTLNSPNGDGQGTWLVQMYTDHIATQGNPTASIHTGAPGGSFTANEVPTSRGYSRQTITPTLSASD